jgi:hypothetical protein
LEAAKLEGMAMHIFRSLVGIVQLDEPALIIAAIRDVVAGIATR